jgi:hypothetical protein
VRAGDGDHNHDYDDDVDYEHVDEFVVFDYFFVDVDAFGAGAVFERAWAGAVAFVAWGAVAGVCFWGFGRFVRFGGVGVFEVGQVAWVGWGAVVVESDVFVEFAGAGAVGRSEFLYRQLPDSAVFVADLSGGGD